MKKSYVLFVALIISGKSFSQTFCSPSGNIAIFSNYDGGILRINVDMNIPNLKIGITGYENDSIIISGAYAGNITQVIFAGYYNSSNVHCTPWPSQKSVNGVPASITQINFAPPAVYFNPYGYSFIICNYSCVTNASQGGCNTADQVAAYFFSQFGSTNLLFHFTQYGCWSGMYNLSSGGNCCAVPSGTGINETENEGTGLTVFPNPASDKISINIPVIGIMKDEIRIFNLPGAEMKGYSMVQNKAGGIDVDLSGFKSGMYFIEIRTANALFRNKFSRF